MHISKLEEPTRHMPPNSFLNDFEIQKSFLTIDDICHNEFEIESYNFQSNQNMIFHVYSNASFYFKTIHGKFSLFSMT